MASVIKIPRKARAGTTPDGKPIWKPAKGLLYYAKIKTLAGEWTQVPTQKTGTAAAAQWAAERCACDRCGGPDRIRKKQQDEAEAAARATDETTRAKTCDELFTSWEASLTNRSADDDKSRIKCHLRPAFADKRLADVTLPTVMQWIDTQRAAKAPRKPKQFGGKRKDPDGRLSDATIRHNLNLLSRFFAWCVERGHAQVNPVRQIPQGRRPRQSPKTDQPWIKDDMIARQVMHTLPEPFDLMFRLGNRSGLRLGEICGLRLSDLGFLDEGVLRVRFSYDGPLKEDKDGSGKTKWAPASEDYADVFKPWLTRREAEGAQPEEYVFRYHASREALKQRVEDEWSAAKARLAKREQPVELGAMSFYQATRHSFVSRNLEAGASLDEVSAAVGHSSPTVTRRFYDHFIRRSFSAGLREGLGAAEAPDSGKVLPIKSGARG